MKRALAAIAVFSVVVLMTVAAQAENKGEQIFGQKCAMCHMIKGKGGAIGPELTKVSTKFKDQDLKAKLENPKKSNPSSSMPAFKTLPKGDMDALLGYLKTMK